jgi:hypothetical protein
LDIPNLLVTTGKTVGLFQDGRKKKPTAHIAGPTIREGVLSAIGRNALL